MAMACTVVIPCHDGVELTRACLASLLAQADSPPDEILIVDNASGDATPDLGALDPRVRVLRLPRNLGFAGGVNHGLRAARHAEILVLNNDTQAAAGLLLELRAVLASDPRIGAVAPVSNHVKGPARVAVGALGKEPGQRAAIAAALADLPRTQDVDTLAGLCLLVRRETFDQAGLFDERFGHGNFEDDDFCLRLRLHGLRLVIARRAFLHHEGHATFQRLGLDLRTEIERRRAQFIAKWQHDPAGAATIAALHGDRQTAGAQARIAGTIWPLWPDADWHLARAAAERGEHATAAAHFASLLQNCPTHSEAALGLLETRLASDDPRATAFAARISKQCFLDQEQARQLLTMLGEQAWRHSEFGQARDHFAAALEMRADDGNLRNWLGLCILKLGDPEAASAAFAEAIDLGCAQAHTNLGICRHSLGDRAAARAHFERAVELMPADPAARNNLAAISR